MNRKQLQADYKHVESWIINGDYLTKRAYDFMKFLSNGMNRSELRNSPEIKKIHHKLSKQAKIMKTSQTDLPHSDNVKN